VGMRRMVVQGCWGLELGVICRYNWGVGSGGAYKQGPYMRLFMVFMDHHVHLLVTFHSTHTNFCPHHVLHTNYN